MSILNKILFKENDSNEQNEKDISIDVQPKICKNPSCTNPIIGREAGSRYCSKGCQVRYNSLKRYNKIKDTEEYKAKRKKYFNKWRSENKEHFNMLMRKYSKEYQTRLRQKQKLEKLEEQNKELKK